MTTKPTPVRSPDQTTFTWSLPKVLKAKLLLVSEAEGRPLSNYLTWLLTPQVNTALTSRGITTTPERIEETLAVSAEKAFRGSPSRKKINPALGTRPRLAITDRKLDFVYHKPDVVLQRELGMKT
jgi:hypothetical protein